MKIKVLLRIVVVTALGICALCGCNRRETYIVFFDANGGTGTMRSQVFEEREAQALRQNTFTRDGYSFSGWNTSQSGSGTAYSNGQTITVSSDMTLYAQWTNNSSSQGGNGSGSGSGTGDDPGNGSGTQGGGNGTHNGHDYVDLGLRSGTLWATCNVGANTPEGSGDLFAWAETSPKESYTQSNYKYYCDDGTDRGYTKYVRHYQNGYPNFFSDGLRILEACDDAATFNWGSGWQTPSPSQVEELFYDCQHVETAQNGVPGNLFRGPNGNTIFIPSIIEYDNKSYYYWTNSLRQRYNQYFVELSVDIEVIAFCKSDFNNLRDRYFCALVRPVRGSATLTPTAPSVITNSATNITPYSATLNGNITSAGGANVTEKGFVYGTNPNNLSGRTQSGGASSIYNETITGLSQGTIYYYKAYATNSAGTTYGDILTFTTNGILNEHIWVDLGLPSGTKWANCNIGATSPEDYGEYFAWGETSPKYIYEWNNYRWCDGVYTKLTKYCNYAQYGNNGFTDNLTTLEASDDAATANWGSGWRMPTETEMRELKDNCIVTWTTQNGKRGRLFTGSNGNFIFLPAAGYHRYGSELGSVGFDGYYWSSSLSSDYTVRAWYLNFDSDNYGMSNLNGERYRGLSVRPVCQ